MHSNAIRAGRALFFAATGAADGQITCPVKTATAAQCPGSCQVRGLYYYQWYPATQNCCCSPIAP